MAVFYRGEIRIQKPVKQMIPPEAAASTPAPTPVPTVDPVTIESTRT
jgi:hypothetical protein